MRVALFSGSDRIEFGADGQFGTARTQPITLNPGGVLDLNDRSANIGRSAAADVIVFSGGGTVTTGSGMLTLGDTGASSAHTIELNSLVSFDQVVVNGGANLGDATPEFRAAYRRARQVVVNGGVNLGDATLAVTLGFTPSAGNTFVLIDNDGTGDAVLGTFNGIVDGGFITIGGIAFQLRYNGGDGNDVVLIVNSARGPGL